jgi:hypothetical protein
MKRFLFAVVMLLGLSGWQTATALGPGCDTSRPAVAHYADGTLASSSGAPVTCSVTTGYGGAEPHLEVAPTGEVVLYPAGLAGGTAGQGVPGPDVGQVESHMFANTWGMLSTSDLGATWQFIEPGEAQFACCDQHVYIDRVTGHLFFSAIFGRLAPAPADFLLAAESQTTASAGPPYDTWTTLTTQVAHVSENPRFTTAPVPPGWVTPPGSSSRIAYWCANSTLSSTTRDCVRSYDDGATWGFASHLYGHPLAATHIQCGGSSETAGYPVGAPDGSVWVNFSCGGNTYLARSTDAATTWPFVATVPFSIPTNGLLIDTAGNLYVVSTSGSALNLRTSTNGGTWSAPLNMTAPAARPSSIGQWRVSTGYRPGDVMVAYLVGSSGGFVGFPVGGGGSGAGADAYITVTHQGLDPNPVFYSAKINPDYRPMVTSGHAGDDFIDGDIGPDGTPWAYFYSNCLRDRHGNFIDPYCRRVNGREEVNGMMVDAHAATIGSLQSE